MERKEQAAVILIACLPPGYGSEIEPRKNVAVEIQCNFTVLMLSGTQSEITFLCKQRL